MVNVTFAVSDGVHSRMRQHDEIRWSHIARKAVEEKLDELEEIERIASKSKLTERDVEEIGAKIKAGRRKLMELEIRDGKRKNAGRQ